MELLLRDSAYTNRLLSFLTSLGQTAVLAAPNRLELDDGSTESARLELEIYLGVWRVLHPDADVEVSA
jgi:hypothetical protein